MFAVHQAALPRRIGIDDLDRYADGILAGR
jgi:hypothetical protein